MVRTITEIHEIMESSPAEIKSNPLAKSALFQRLQMMPDSQDAIRRTLDGMAAMAVVGFVLDGGTPEAVRTGHLDSDRYIRVGERGRGPEGMTTYPAGTVVYPTRAAADAAQDKIESRCSHDWVMTSHEEKRCLVCNAYRFVMDM